MPIAAETVTQHVRGDFACRSYPIQSLHFVIWVCAHSDCKQRNAQLGAPSGQLKCALLDSKAVQEQLSYDITSTLQTGCSQPVLPLLQP